MRTPRGKQRLAVGALAVAIALTGTTSSANAQSPVGGAPPSVHRLRIVVDPGVVTGLSTAEVERRLGIYVDDLNTVFERETVRSFSFATGDLTLAAPSTVSACNGIMPAPVPTPPEIWVCIKPSTIGYSHSGNAGTSATGGHWGLVQNLNWPTIHDPAALTGTTLPGMIVTDTEDYLLRQFRTLVHEIEHTFGAGFGEYYNLFTTDRTGIAPILDLRPAPTWPTTTHPYWTPRLAWRRDPLLGGIYRDPVIGNPTDRAAVLAAIQFTPGTRAMIDTDWDNKPAWGGLFGPDYLADTAATDVVVTDAATGDPIAGAAVKVWNVPAPTTAPLDPRADGIVGANGRLTFSWGCGTIGCWNNYDSILLAKAWAPGYEGGLTWWSIYDAFEQKAVGGQNELTIDVRLAPIVPDTTPPTITLTEPSDGARVRTGQTLVADYTCDDPPSTVPASGVASCTGTLPDGATIGTSTPGVYSFTVDATDNAGNVAQLTHTYTVLDPATSGPFITVSDVSVLEGDDLPRRYAKLVVSLSEPAPATGLTLRYSTASGTAADTTDFVAKRNVLLRFLPGQTARLVSIPIVPDSSAEADERLTVAISSASTGTVLDASGEITIRDDDGFTGARAAIASASIVEGDQGSRKLVVAVNLSTAPGMLSSLYVTTVDGTATSTPSNATGDFRGVSRELRFLPTTNTRYLTIWLEPDTDHEGTESFSVVLTAPGYTIIGPSTATITIRDDD